MKTISVAEIFDAIEKNGLPKIKGSFFTDVLAEGEEFYHFPFDGERIEKPVAGCALGQAALNLGISPRVLNEVGSAIWAEGYSLTNWIVEKNDSTNYSLKEIADRGRKVFVDILDRTLEVPEP